MGTGFDIREAIINVTSGCPFSCSFCLLDASISRNTLIDVDSVIDFLFGLRSIFPRFSTIDVSGGGPNIWPSYEDF